MATLMPADAAILMELPEESVLTTTYAHKTWFDSKLNVLSVGHANQNKSTHVAMLTVAKAVAASRQDTVGGLHGEFRAWHGRTRPRTGQSQCLYDRTLLRRWRNGSVDCVLILPFG